MIVEDDVFVMDIYQTKLTQEGFEVMSATNGMEGLKKLPLNNDGVWSLPGGKEYYEYAIKTHTTTSLSADQLQPREHQDGVPAGELRRVDSGRRHDPVRWFDDLHKVFFLCCGPLIWPSLHPSWTNRPMGCAR